MPGAVKVLKAADIPSGGKNDFTYFQSEEVSDYFILAPIQVFSSKIHPCMYTIDLRNLYV